MEDKTAPQMPIEDEDDDEDEDEDEDEGRLGRG
jgi:hypothetical protein